MKSWSIRIFNTIFGYISHTPRRRKKFWPEMGLANFPSKKGRLFLVKKNCQTPSKTPALRGVAYFLA